MKPKGDRPAREPKPESDVKAPRKPSQPRNLQTVPSENPEQWGRFYFRDTILEQLDNYWIYLKRMKLHDKDAYELLKRVGIQIMPYDAIKTFDNWRGEGSLDDLSAWWKEHRPGFGAIAYGIDHGALKEEQILFADWENLKIGGNKKFDDPDIHTGRVVAITGTDYKPNIQSKYKNLGTMWVPKFLYFSKYTKAPAGIEQRSGGDIYSMTVYWDRIDKFASKMVRRSKGGWPQEYAVFVAKETGAVEVLHIRRQEHIVLPKGGDFTRQRWVMPDRYLTWARGRLTESPEDYLKRLFIEAALMYETAAMGSMIRVAVEKGSLTAVFGIEMKRTAYFFKDRDLMLNQNGRQVPIFHMVRAHKRVRKTGEESFVHFHFRGLRDFTWAGYKVSITVPARDHIALPEFDVGIREVNQRKLPEGMIGAAELGDKLVGWIKGGRGGKSNVP